jgi:hypothetical protein
VKQKNALFSIGTMLGMALLISLLAVGLLSCGSSQGNQSSSIATPTHSTQLQQCGKVQKGPQGILLNATTAAQATNCFWQAYQQCHLASLIFTTSSVDTAVIRTFTIKNNNNQCSITDSVQHAYGPSPLSAAKIYTCVSLTQKSDGLHFASCGQDGDIIVPVAKEQ